MPEPGGPPPAAGDGSTAIMAASWIPAGWEAPPWIRAGTTTRLGGVSRPPFDSLNLARHVHDDDNAVRRNRRRLQRLCRLPAEPPWLIQTHSNRVTAAGAAANPAADAIYTDRPGTVCAVLTADCVPVLLCDRPGTVIAAVHVGWRGLCAGILENTLHHLGPASGGLLAWLGPHICAAHYEVGTDVREACLHRFPHAEQAFRENGRGRWQCSLEALIRQVLEARGATVTAAGHCTFGESGRFYSYRRNRETGRMASLIWMDKTVV